MKSKLMLIGTIVTAITLLSACTKEILKGHGDIITETRTLTDFSKVSIAGDRTVEIIKSNDSKVELTGYANLVSEFRSTVNNGRLEFGYDQHTWAMKDNIRMKIYTPNVEAVDMSGSGDITVSDGFDQSSFNIDISGSCTFKMGHDNFNNIKMHTSGDAEIYAEQIVAKNAEVHVSGSANIRVHAEDYLKVRLSGSGEVHYWGNPATDIDISGSGKVTKH